MNNMEHFSNMEHFRLTTKFGSGNLHAIFSVPIYEIKLDLDLEKLKSFCTTSIKTGAVRTKSNVGGKQSDDLPLHSLSEKGAEYLNHQQEHKSTTGERADSSLDALALQPLIQEVEKHTSKFTNGNQIVWNMWININQYRDWNRPHFHPFCLFSGVYYVQTPKDCGNIVFEHPAENELIYYNKGKGALHELPAIENTLYIFPSWLKHYVDENKNEKEERISISFNTVNGA